MSRRGENNSEGNRSHTESCTSRSPMRPLEFTECVVDSPTFRQNLHSHEKELDSTIQAVKDIEQKTREVLKKVEELSEAQREWTEALRKTRLEDISVRIQGSVEETVLRSSFAQFASVIDEIEEQHKTIVQVAKDSFIEPLRKFRKEDLGEAVDARNRFREATKRFCSQSDAHAAFRMSGKVEEQTRRNEEAQFEKDRLEYIEQAFDYVHKIHCAQERKKFVFIEVLLTYMNQWRVFYMNAKETFDGSSEYLQELQILLQKSRENYGAFVQKSVELQTEMRTRVRDPAALEQVSRTSEKKEGYLLSLRSRFARTEVEKFFCLYDRPTKSLTMTSFTQTQTHLRDNLQPLRYLITGVDRRPVEKSIDLRRFCFDVTVTPLYPLPPAGGAGGPMTIMLQCFTQFDMDAWLAAIADTGKSTLSVRNARDGPTFVLNQATIANAARCISAIERAIEMPGVYRVPGNKQKQKELIEAMGSNEPVNMEAYKGCESTITSTLKACIRGLQPAIIPTSQYENYLKLVQLEADARLGGLAALLNELEEPNRLLLRIFMHHLLRIAAHSEQNRMTVTNLAVCVGPSILHSAQPDTMQAASELPYVNAIVECMIQHAERLFGPDDLDSVLQSANAEAASADRQRSPMPTRKVSDSESEVATREAAVTRAAEQRDVRGSVPVQHLGSHNSHTSCPPGLDHGGANLNETPSKERTAASPPESVKPESRSPVASALPVSPSYQTSSSSPARSNDEARLSTTVTISKSPSSSSQQPQDMARSAGVGSTASTSRSDSVRQDAQRHVELYESASTASGELRAYSQSAAAGKSKSDDRDAASHSSERTASEKNRASRGSASKPGQLRWRGRFGSSHTRNSGAFNFMRGWATALSNSAHLAARIAGEPVDRNTKFLSLPVQRAAGEDQNDSVFDNQLNSGEAMRGTRVPRATTVSAPSFVYESELDFIDDQQG